MARYALVDQTGTVDNVIEWDGVAHYIPPAGLTAILAGSAGRGWTFANGVFTAPVVSPPSLTQQYMTAMTAGCPLIYPAVPSVSATYALDPATISDYGIEAQFIQTFGGFTTGSTLTLPTLTGNVTFPSTASFLAVVKALAVYVSGCKQAAAGIIPAFPATPVTISG